MSNNGIIFDLDGTLWDASEGVIKSWNEIIDTYPEIDYKMTSEAIRGFMGKTIQQIAKLFFYNVSEEKGLEIALKCCSQEQKYLALHGGLLYPRLEETLEQLSGNYKLFIVSNCQMGYLEAFFKYHKLEGYFSDYENSGRTGKAKGDNIKLVIERNDLDKALYIGDTQGDFDGANIAEIPFIHAKYGFGTINEVVPFVSEFSDIPAKVKELLK